MVWPFRFAEASKLVVLKEARVWQEPSFVVEVDLVRVLQFIESTNMSPRGKAKAKQESDENGREKRVRESRNVKATSYKDLSDSEEEKPVRRRKKKDSESESMSEDERPKKRVAKGRRASARSRKDESDSEEVSDYVSEESSGEDSKKKRKSGRKPARSLRAPARKASYKDLSDSEDDSNEDDEEEEEEEEDFDSSSEKEEKSKEKRKRGRPAKNVKKSKEESDSGSEGAEEEEEEEEEEEDGEEEDEKEEGDAKGAKEVKPAKKSVTESSTDSKSKGKDESVDKTETEKKDVKPRPEHELSEEGEEDDEEDDDEEKSEGEESKSKKKESKEEESGPNKRGRPAKTKEEKEEEEPEAKKAKVADKPAMNKTDSDYGSIDFSSEAKTKEGNKWNLKISSWNVAGLKAWLKKSGLEFIKHENPDILCLQETKCSEKKLPPEAKVDGYHTYWLSGEKEGYAGVALLSKTKPIEVKYGLEKPELDNDGRVITAEFDKFFVVNVYVPNAGQGLKTLPRRLEWDPVFRAHLKSLDEKKPVILCGDLNVAHNEIDLSNPKTNVKNAGFTPQEREGMTQLLKEGFVDTFRNLYPDKTGAYSFWTYMGNARSRNVGWRLDYFITSERFLSNVCDNVMRSEVYGSDHCPITLFVHV